MRIALFIAAACAALSTPAATWDLQLGPKDAEGFGLNGLNETVVPPAGVSPAQGDEDMVYGGVHFDDKGSAPGVLSVNLIWGDHPDSGGTDLMGTFSAAYIYGPAPVGTSTDNILYNLTSYFADLTEEDDSGREGAINAGYDGVPGITLTDIGDYTVAQQEADLLNGLWYINILTSTHPDGEIRGQLTVIPEPQHYAAFAGLALLGFAGFRRYKAAHAA